MKHILAALLLLTLLLSLASCGAPDLSEVKDTYISLIESSYAINDIFFGEGLATYEKGTEVYTDFPEEYGFYEIVDIECGYLGVDSVKAVAEQIYSKDYLEGIYTMAFDGYANGGEITTARYLEADGYFLRYAYGEKDTFDLMEGKQRRFLFDTMNIVRPSSKNYVNLRIDSYLIGEEDNILTITLRFVLQDGEWRLDSPTY